MYLLSGSSKRRLKACPVSSVTLLIAFILMAGLMTVQRVGAQEATPTSITLTWTAPGDDGNIGTASQYDIRYSVLPLNESNWTTAVQVDNEPVPKPAGQSESFTVTDLQPGTDYYFGIKAVDEASNWSGLSNVVLRQTLDEDIPPADIANLMAVSSTVTTVTLSWSAPGDDGNSGVASEYDIRYATVPITASNWSSAVPISGEPEPLSAGGAESFDVTGLNPGTLYYFAIKTADEVPNWSGLSNIASRATENEQNPPAAVADLSITDVAATSISLRWTAPGDDGNTGTASQYDIRYAIEPITDSNWDDAVQVGGETSPKSAGSTERFTVTGLSPGTAYYWAIKTADEVPNWSALSNVASGSTVDNIPPATINDLTILFENNYDRAVFSLDFLTAVLPARMKFS